MAANSDDLLFDFSPMLKQYKDGRIERLMGDNFVPPSLDPTTGVQSKDVEISPEINLSARLYLPANASPTNKLPLLVYFHGGGFVVESAFSPLYHKHLNLLVAEANVVAVSVNYRLAPEHPLPTAYEDSWRAVKWIANQPADDWIREHADLDRVYFAGDSAGGNISHHMATRVGSEKLEGMNLCGIILNCPYFWGANPIGIEINHPFKSFIDKLLGLAAPDWDFDASWINPEYDPNVPRLGCKKVLIYVAGLDILKERGQCYKEVLSTSGFGGDIEWVEVEEENHVFSVLAPDTDNSRAMLKKVATFINR